MNTSKTQQESHEESNSEIKRRRTANKNTVLVMALLFVALISGSSTTRSPNGNLTTRDVVWGVLSVLGFAALIWSLYISYKLADERQKLIHLKASSMIFVAVIFSLVTAQILYALDIVSLTISVQIIVIGGLLLWTFLLKAVEKRSE